MGLFIFLIILLAAAWGLVLQFDEPPPAPSQVSIVQHAPAQSKSAAPASS